MTIEQVLQISYADIVVAATDSSRVVNSDKLIEILEDEWIATYYDMSSHSPNVMKFLDHGFTFLYDQASVNAIDVDDRLVVGYGCSIPNEHKRDISRMQGFLGGGIDIPDKGKFDKGHVMAHAIGGGTDVNLFPQRPELNRGRSEAGRRYQRMERYAAVQLGTFVFSRMIYSDNSWVPSSLEYGVLKPDGKIWVEWFEN